MCSEVAQKVGATVGTTAAPDKRRQLRGMGGADGLNASNSRLRFAFPHQHRLAANKKGATIKENGGPRSSHT
jgi:hypothetical protein